MSFELKPFHRVKLRNGREGIIVANPNTVGRYSEYKLLIIFTDDAAGFMPGVMEEEGGQTEWNVQQVWDTPDYYADLLTFCRKGDTLWKEKSEAVTKAEADVASAKVLLASAEARLQAAVEASK